MLGYIGDDYLKAPLQRGKQAEFHVKKSDSITGVWYFAASKTCGFFSRHRKFLTCISKDRILSYIFL